MAERLPIEELLRAELTQLDEEGRDVSALREELEHYAGLTSPSAAAAFDSILHRCGDAPVRPDFPYEEPSGLEEIRMSRVRGPRQMTVTMSRAELADKMHGAWLGRIAGCMLGKPVEGQSWTNIKALLEHAGAYPLSDYFPPIDPVPEGHHYPGAGSPVLLGNITHGVRDDDTDYTILGLHIAEESGRSFTASAVGQQWLLHFPYHCVYTAERVAYHNLVMGLAPPATADHRNPFREWIGAQIRADFWGYVNPGNPELAAEYAHRDASLSHVKNGIYGEMFFSALLAAGFATTSLSEAIDAALSEVPANCRFAEAVRDVRAWAAEADDWTATWDRIREKYGHYHGVHTINNAAVVLMGLLHSKGDFEKAICISVMAGLDTDCNGATAGSVMGLMLGASQLPQKWVAPLGDRVESVLVGMTDCRISDLTERSLKLAEQR